MNTKKMYRSFILCSVSILFFLCLLSVNGYAQVTREQVVEQARLTYPKVERIHIDSSRGVPLVVRGVLARNIDLRNGNQVQSFFQTSAEVFKINNQTDDFNTKEISTDELGMTHRTLQQEYKGVPVWGSVLKLHATSSNDLREMSGRFVPNLNIDVRASISSERALDIALDDLGPAEYRWQNPAREQMIQEIFDNESRSWKPDPTLMIAPVNGNFDSGEYRLVWKMMIAVDGTKLGNWEYFVDAHTGEIINKYNSMPDITGSGDSNYNGTVSFETHYNSTNHNFELYDATRNIKTYTANNSSNDPGTLVTHTDNDWDQHSNAVDAHWGMKKVYDFWDAVFGRDGYDDSGSLIINTVDYVWDTPSGPDPNNATSMGGGQFLFGSGDGSTFSSVTALDVVGHEFNHAVDDFEADLIYQGESGAIDESLADIMGTAIEFYSTPSEADWLLGEDCYTPGSSGDALRYMNNPKVGNHPDTYQGTNWASTSGGDNGGVHTNSGVLNYAFYLMTEGGSGTNDFGDAYSLSGIGITKTRSIAHRAFTTYFTSSDDYADARERFLSAASDLYGSSGVEYKSVSDAFGAVGIGVRYVAENNFNAGTIKINGYTTGSGSSFFPTDGDSQTLQAIEQNYGSYDRVWNTSGTSESNSTWRKRPQGGSEQKIPGATNISYSFTASSSDHNAAYIADLRKAFNITLNDYSPELGSNFNSVNLSVIEGNTITAPLTQTDNGTTYQFLEWSDGVSDNT